MFESFADEMVKISASNPGMLRKIHNKILDVGARTFEKGRLQEMSSAAQKAARKAGKSKSEVMKAGRSAATSASAKRGYGIVGGGTAAVGTAAGGGYLLANKKKDKE